jgi:3D (Asp-Asp-Asp) domain-containing protein
MGRIFHLALPGQFKQLRGKPHLLGLALVVLALSAGLAWGRPHSFSVKATAYTSSVRETDQTPFITATGARTRMGIIAVSRDMLRGLPYGSRVMLQDLGSVKGRGVGRFNYLLRDRVFVVEDTMNPRIRNRIDIWLPNRRLALNFGARKLRVTVLRVGR